MLHFLDDIFGFPHPDEARSDGLLAVGGDLSTARLMLAYRSGIFPWFSDGDPILWWSPDPRMVLFPSEFKRSKSLRKSIRTKGFTITQNTQFEEVMRACASAPRPDQLGTWITEEMIQAYLQLNQLGHARSVEVWLEDELVGGLYGIDLPEYKVFCGESMFSKVSDASKVCFSFLVDQLSTENYKLIDCQMYTDHLASLGAKEIARKDFLDYLKPA
ncbi:leucyl/phenylalanyl-tRNA--protein transferase [Gilvibacter sediminis]|uniref:leucyl/phenylalanyl-tRNA--protein transferase n=1 Tax=Gilvibacter sediminis TaxID=379071 RepID=UPI0023505059|nr:leucyl/phenylalanyl-tRNA--protein transferase [Gilvibacter sediminis]MDC7997189.1 leucyl/phenylalanyl-tRNA--protein transferase [Gilvibacter sediminis]